MLRDNNTDDGTFQQLKGGASQHLDPQNLYKFDLESEGEIRLLCAGKFLKLISK